MFPITFPRQKFGSTPGGSICCRFAPADELNALIVPLSCSVFPVFSHEIPFLLQRYFSCILLISLSVWKHNAFVYPRLKLPQIEFSAGRLDQLVVHPWRNNLACEYELFAEGGFSTYSAISQIGTARIKPPALVSG